MAKYLDETGLGLMWKSRKLSRFPKKRLMIYLQRRR